MSDSKAMPLWRELTFMVGMLLVACERSEIERIQNEKTKQANVDYNDLEFGTDGLWRKVGVTKPFTGKATRKHPNGKLDWQTHLEGGRPTGRIREWDPDGNPIWPK